jgi:hypothetical protein
MSSPRAFVGIVMLLVSMKSQVLSMSFRTQGWVDVKPPNVADSLRECTTTSPQVWQTAVNADVVEVFFSRLSIQSGNSLNIFAMKMK